MKWAGVPVMCGTLFPVKLRGMFCIRCTTQIPAQASPYVTVRLSPSINLSGVTDVDFMIGLSTPCVYTDGELTSVETQRTNLQYGVI